MGAEPTPQQRPEPFQRVDVHLAEPVPVVVPGVLARRMADRLVAVAPLGEPGVDVVLVGVDERPLGDRPPDQGPIVTCLTLANIRITTWPPRWIIPKIGGFSFASVPRPARPLQPPAAGGPPFFLTASGWPL